MDGSWNENAAEAFRGKKKGNWRGGKNNFGKSGFGKSNFGKGFGRGKGNFSGNARMEAINRRLEKNRSASNDSSTAPMPSPKSRPTSPTAPMPSPKSRTPMPFSRKKELY